MESNKLPKHMQLFLRWFGPVNFWGLLLMSVPPIVLFIQPHLGICSDIVLRMVLIFSLSGSFIFNKKLGILAFIYTCILTIADKILC